MSSLLDSRLSDFKKKSYSELCQLENYQGEKVKVEGKTVSIGIWKDMLSDDEIQIVMQVYRPWFLGIGKMAAGGFRVSKADEVKKLSREELYDFT